MVPYGKRLPDAIYIYRPETGSVSKALLAEIQRAEVAAHPPSNWNLLKLHINEVALTFLFYPHFESDPHPALAEATKINLNTGSIVRIDYQNRANPPILHRKETFLPSGHKLRAEFEALTRAEEEAGLYLDTTRIGNRVHWHNLLRRKKFGYEGHRLVPLKSQPTPLAEVRANDAVVERHRTAIKRYDLSKPVKLLFKRGLLRKHDTFFDYGCGHAMDVEALRSLGYEAVGWDPAFCPNSPKTPASVVNLGYVLNVIENPSERVTALREAFSLAERLMIVSTMVVGQETHSHSRQYGDGFLTKTNTFQKFYAPGELEALIEEALDVEVSTLGLGICVAFRDPDEAEAFQATRNRTRIDWTDLSLQLRFSLPTRRDRHSVSRYQLNKDLFDDFWKSLLDLGRLPQPGEFDRLNDVRRAAGGLKRALALLVAQNGAQPWEHARKIRADDVLVYLAMTNFRKRFLRREIPPRVKHDIRSFFGDLKRAHSKARDLLFAAGDPDEIELACEDVGVGWQEADALYIYRDLLGRLPPILRLYVASAAVRYGDPEAADIIKLHKRSGKVTFLVYDDFLGKPLPELRIRVKVNLRTLFVQVFEYPPSTESQLLYFKERYLAPNHPGIERMKTFAAKLRRFNLSESMGFGPLKNEFLSLAESRGLNSSLNRLRAHG
jgi:DNA phosphorothioation-associated putative methyltransferase